MLDKHAFLAAAALAAGPFVFMKGFKTVRTRRLIANTPTARIRSMAMGLVEVTGLAETRSVLSAPFSGRPCLYWEVEIASKSRNNWSTIHRNQSGHPFFLRDETGLALVYPQGADSRLPVSGEDQCSGLMLPSVYSDYMSSHTGLLQHITRVGIMRFREKTIDEGSRLYVLGTATPRSQARVISEGDPAVFAAGADAAVARLRARDQEAVAVIRRGVNEPTFIISQESERSLMLELGGRALLEVAGGPALTLYGFAYWLFYLQPRLQP